LCGYAEHFTDFESTPRIRIRRGVFTGSCPSGIDLNEQVSDA
jgi:hypothetical protein